MSLSRPHKRIVTDTYTCTINGCGRSDVFHYEAFPDQKFMARNVPVGWMMIYRGGDALPYVLCNVHSQMVWEFMAKLK